MTFRLSKSHCAYKINQFAYTAPLLSDTPPPFHILHPKVGKPQIHSCKEQKVHNVLFCTILICSCLDLVNYSAFSYFHLHILMHKNKSEHPILKPRALILSWSPFVPVTAYTLLGNFSNRFLWNCGDLCSFSHKCISALQGKGSDLMLEDISFRSSQRFLDGLTLCLSAGPLYIDKVWTCLDPFSSSEGKSV